MEKNIMGSVYFTIFQTIILPFFLFLSCTLPSSWTRAQELCATWHETANLVSIHDHLENDFVTKQLAAHGAHTGTWIGYHRQPGSKYPFMLGHKWTQQKTLILREKD